MLSTKYTKDRLNINKSVNKGIMVNRKMNFGWEIEKLSSFSSVCRRYVVNWVPIASLWNRSPVWILSTAISAATSIQCTIPSSLNMVMVSWWSPSFHACSPSVYSPHRNQSDPVKTQASGATPLLKNPLMSEKPVSLKIKARVFGGYTLYDLPLTTLICSHLPLTLCLLAGVVWGVLPLSCHPCCCLLATSLGNSFAHPLASFGSWLTFLVRLPCLLFTLSVVLCFFFFLLGTLHSLIYY